MISGLTDSGSAASQRRLLVVGHRELTDSVVDGLRHRFDDWTVGTSESYLSGIADLSRTPAQAVLAFVDPGLAQLDHAVAGLRSAAGKDARIVLCCPPECEPLTRSVVKHGANDYIIYPLDHEEVADAIGQPTSVTSTSTRLTETPAASMDEFVQLASILSHLSDDPHSIFERIASLLKTAFKAKSVTVVVSGTVATAGDPVIEPVLTAPLSGAQGPLGQVSLSQREQDTYTPADVLKLTHYAGVISHLIEAATKQRRLRDMAITDECSGLPNRRHFHQRVDEILKRAAVEHFHVTLLLFDIDDFKTYNDTYGHDVGDEIIRSTGEVFRKHCRDQDIVARYGGDEFAVCFWDPQGPRKAGSQKPDSAMAVLDRVKEALKTQPMDHLGKSGVGRLTISGGVATFPWDGATRQELIKKADDALLAAKRAGKNRVFLIGESDAR